MTSLSKIIRSNHLEESQTSNFRTIEIQELFLPNQEIEGDITPQNILEERNRLINEAKQEIEQQRKAFEQQSEEERKNLEALKVEWEQEKVELRQQAYEEGFQQGLEEGRLKAEANMAKAIQLANNTIVQSKANAEQYLQEQEQIILDLAIRSAEKILGTVLEENHERFLDIVRRGLKEAREMKEIKLYVSPAYHQLVTMHREELSSIFPTGVPFMIFVNEEIEETDCYIETNHGRIMVGIDEQLNELKSKLIEILESVD